MNSPSTVTSSSPGPKRSFKRKVLWVVAFAALAGGGWWVWQKFIRTQNPREQYQIATIQRGDIQDLVTATGTVQPRDYVDVGAQVSGQLKKLHVEVGSVVQAGDLLAQIDPTVLTATVDARRAGLRNQRATLTERESSLALATIQYNRQKNLAAADATTTEQLQLAEASLRSAKAQIAAIKAQIEQTESTLRADEATLNYARIFAPMSGTVVSVTARQGQTLNANQSAPNLMRIADLSTMTVQTQVSEAEVSKLRQGMEVYFTTLGGQGRRWYGALRKVEPTPTVTNNVVLYNALFDVPNTNQALMPSMTTQVFFIAASAENVLVVPTSAVTMQRPQGGGGRRDRGAGPGAGGSPGAAASAASGVAASASTASIAASSVPGRGASAAGGNSRYAGMSQEERRATMEAMSPEERAAMRERRNAQRALEAGGAAASAPAAAMAAAPAPARPPSEGRAGGGGGAGGAGGDSRFANMSPEERRAAFEAMSPEERAAMRERRRAQREREGGDASAGGPAAGAASASTTASAAPLRSPAAPERVASAPRRAPRAERAASGADTAASGPVSRGVTGGFAPATPRAPRRGTVKVIDAEGKIEERQVELGVTTRVQAQVLSGLKEGDEVITGMKLPPAAQQRAAQTQGGGQGPGQGQGGMPGVPGQGGGGRGR
ncbi:MAG: hypothetical protein RLZZ618_3492 [Pseudomonadota bacterium]